MSTLTSTRRRFTWVDESVAHFLDRHSLGPERMTPRGAPLEDFLLVRTALMKGWRLPLTELPGAPLAEVGDPTRPAGALAGLFISHYCRQVPPGVISTVGELLAGLGGLQAPHLEGHQEGFDRFLRDWGEVAQRLYQAREQLQQVISRLRSTHNKFAEVTTAERHREEARLYALRQQGRRPGQGDEYLRDTPTRVSRGFQEAAGKTVVAQREVDLACANLYDVGRRRHLPAPAQQALEAVRALRADAEAAGARAVRYPRIRRAASDLRTAATHGTGRLEHTVGLLRLPPDLVARLQPRG
jgi:hypothetical protein